MRESVIEHLKGLGYAVLKLHAIPVAVELRRWGRPVRLAALRLKQTCGKNELLGAGGEPVPTQGIPRDDLLAYSRASKERGLPFDLIFVERSTGSILRGNLATLRPHSCQCAGCRVGKCTSRGFPNGVYFRRSELEDITDKVLNLDGCAP